MREITTIDNYINKIRKSDASEPVKKRLIEEAIELYWKDQHTQLFNRSYLITRLGEMIAESQREPKTDLKIVFYDLDNFKLINDTYGHPKGDEMISDFANILRKIFPRSTDLIAKSRSTEYSGTCELRRRVTDQVTDNGELSVRYAGEEYVSVHQKVKKEKIYNKAEKVRKCAEENAIECRKRKGKIIHLGGTVSIGIGDVNDIDQIKILYDREGNRMVIGSFDGKYAQLIKDFSNKIRIKDERIDAYLKEFKNVAEKYLDNMELNLSPKNALTNGSHASELRNYLAVMSFLSEVDKRGLQPSKRYKNKITML